MDPFYWEATTRHQTPKAKQGKAQNSVERQFRKNPFAKALSTPIRQCTASRKRFPAFFLQDFNLIAHPETSEPWWVPHSLLWEQHTVAAQPVNAAGDEEFHDEHMDIAIEEEKADPTEGGPTVKTPATVRSKNAQPYGPSAYVLARQDLISGFTTKGSGYENLPRRLFGGSSSRYVKLGGKAIWREDMDSLVMHRMRQGIIEDLLYLSSLCIEDNRSYIKGCHSWDDVEYKPNRAVLWFGDDTEPNEAGKPKIQPGPFSTCNSQTANGAISMAVHNIPMLLGAQGTADVRQKSAMFADISLFLLSGRRTTDLQLKLWRLQGYLADFKRESEDDQP
ncbi:hypothetical protein ONZ43_g4262 [Nemania bipapillata]|uniref:Uncharacterized protein n=1 Tax=Nemania bipapillata TaxID=110536 RepID=A0ACC2IPZ4_9PEZI|nr:hypothetical protein ONZ43_g4262 [Nemania bipapillata]